MRVPHVRAAVFCALVLTPVGAAGQVSPRPTGINPDANTDVAAFYKTLGSAVRLQPGLIEVTDLLQRLLLQARLEHPELYLPVVAAPPTYGASSGNTARVWGRTLFKNRIELSAGWQVDATIASDPALVGSTGIGGSLPVTATQAASRRLVDFNREWVNRDRFLLQQNLDLAAVKLILPKGELVVGRQVLSWGTGRLWNPTDLLSPFAPTDVDREVRHGVDAVRYSRPLSNTSLLDVLYLPQKEGWAQGGVVRMQANARGFDMSVSAAKYVADLVFGVDTAGDLGPMGVHAELAYTRNLPNLDGSGTEVEERFVRGVAGVEWRPQEDWIFGAEYYFNGYGATRPAGYADKLRSSRVVRGEVFGAGRHYVGVSTVWTTTELLSLQTLLLSNLADPSVLLIPVSEYWAAQKVILRIGGYVPIGSRPDAGPLRRLTISDVVSGSAVFLAGVRTLGLRSEYGSSPWGAFAQLGIYF